MCAQAETVVIATVNFVACVKLSIGPYEDYILRWNQLNTPMQRNVTIDEVGGAGVYLLSELAGAVTGTVHYVDCGYHVVGMKHPEAPDIGLDQG